ncbi:hypothetical protein [Sporosarcina sp. OR05]|uniref:hypothetical protein n=1 Tax=Sporosarcina sp. OR05 TaxID=2969819 RepID=UPI00352AFEBA
MEKLQGIVVDIQHSVFENQLEALMYVVKDVYAADTKFIFSIPAFTFSIAIEEENYNWHLEEQFRLESLFQPERKEKLKEEMRRIIKHWYDF